MSVGADPNPAPSLASETWILCMKKEEPSLWISPPSLLRWFFNWYVSGQQVSWNLEKLHSVYFLLMVFFFQVLFSLSSIDTKQLSAGLIILIHWGINWGQWKTPFFLSSQTLTNIVAIRPDKAPKRAPTITSDGLWTATYNLEKPMRIAMIKTDTRIFLYGMVRSQAEASPNAAHVCPDGKE